MSSGGDFNHIPELLQAIHEGAKKAVKKAAFDAEGHAKQIIRDNHQVDTGNMLNGTYTVTADSSTYPGSADKNLLPEVPKPADDLTAILAFAASYSAYQNYGTRFQPARPFAEPAADAVRGSLAQTFAALMAAEIKRVVK